MRCLLDHGGHESRSHFPPSRRLINSVRRPAYIPDPVALRIARIDVRSIRQCITTAAYSPERQRLTNWVR